MKKLVKYSRNLDVFGTGIELSLKQQKTHKTFFGTFMTICVIIACFLGSRQIGSDFIVKEDPDMLYKEMIYQNIDVINEWQNLEMKFVIQDSITQQNINAKQLTIDKTISIKVFYQQSTLKQQELNIQWLDNGFAFQISNEGMPELVNFKNIVVSINGLTLVNYQLAITYRQYFFRSDDFENPFHSNHKTFTYSLNNVGIEMVFFHTEISTDRGLIMQSFESDYQLLFAEKYNVESKPSDNPNESRFIVSISDVSKYYKRKYLKIQNLLAIIGGLLKSLLVVGKFISKPVAKLSIRSRLLNEMFNFAELQNFQHSNSQLNIEKPPSNPPPPPSNAAGNACKNTSNNINTITNQTTIADNKTVSTTNNIKLNKNYLTLNTNIDQQENDTMIPKNNINNNNNQINNHNIKDDKKKGGQIQKLETQYFDNLNLNTEANNNEGLALNLAKSNIFQIQLQNQIEKNLVSQKSISSKRQNYLNQNSRNSNISFQSPGKASKMNFFMNSKVPTQNQIQQNSNLLTPPKFDGGVQTAQLKFDYRKQHERNISVDTSPKSENTQTKKQNQPNANNALTLQKKKSFQSKKTNSLKAQEMYLISEVPQENQDNISRAQDTVLKQKRSNQFFSQFPHQISQNIQFENGNQSDKRINQFNRNQLNPNNENNEMQNSNSTSIQQRFKRMSVEIPILQANKIAEQNNKNNSNSSQKKQPPPQKEKRPSISFEASGEVKYTTEPKQPTLTYIESLSQINQNPRVPLLENQSNTQVNIPCLNNINSQQEQHAVVTQQRTTSLENKDGEKGLNKQETGNKKESINQIQLEEQFPVLKKSNTQYVADLIEERAKAKTKTVINVSQSNNNQPSNRVSLNQQGQGMEHKDSLQQKQSDGKSNGQDKRELKKFDKMIENKQTNTLKLGFLDYIKYFIFKKDKKKTQINYCMKKVKQRLDIVYILNKLVEIDKLKMLFLDQNQRELFEFLPRPVVLQKKNEDINELNDRYNIQEAWSLLQEEKNTIDKATDACISYKIMAGKKKKNVLDDRLLEMLDINIRHVFDQTMIPTEIIEEKKGMSQVQTNLHNRQNQLFNMHEKKANNKETIPQHQPQLLKRNTSNKSQKTQKSHNANIKKKYFVQKPTDDVFNAYYDSQQPSAAQYLSGQETPLSLRDGFNKKQSSFQSSELKHNRLKDLLKMSGSNPKHLRKHSEKHLSNHSRKFNSQDYLSDANSTEGNQKAKVPYNNSEIKHKNFNQIPYSQYGVQNQSSFRQNATNQKQQQILAQQQNLLSTETPPQRQAFSFSFHPYQENQKSNEHQNFAQMSFSSQHKLSTQSNQITQQDSTLTPYMGAQPSNNFNPSHYKLSLPQHIALSDRQKSPSSNRSRKESAHSIPESVAEENNQHFKKYDLPQSNITTKLQNIPHQILQEKMKSITQQQINQEKEDKLKPLDQLIQRNESINYQDFNHKEDDNVGEEHKQQKRKVIENNFHLNAYSNLRILITENSSDGGDIENGLQNKSSSSHKMIKTQQENNNLMLTRKKINTMSKSLDISRSDSSNNSQKQQELQPPPNLFLKDNMNLKQYYQLAKPIKNSIFNQK